MLYPEVFCMKNTQTIDCRLKPETKSMLGRGGALLAAFYGAAAALQLLAGVVLDYQLALIWSERLAAGMRGGFGLLCIGFLVMECK